MKFAFLADYSGNLSKARACRVMGVTDRGLRAWKRRPPSQRQRRDMVLLRISGTSIDPVWATMEGTNLNGTVCQAAAALRAETAKDAAEGENRVYGIVLLPDGAEPRLQRAVRGDGGR